MSVIFQPWGCIPLDAVVFHVILSPSLVILNEVKDLALRVNSAKDLSSLDSSAPPHPPEDGFVLLAKNDTLDEVGYAPNYDAQLIPFFDCVRVKFNDFGAT